MFYKPLRQVFENALSIFCAFLASLIFLNDLLPDEPISNDHVAVDRTARLGDATEAGVAIAAAGAETTGGALGVIAGSLPACSFPPCSAAIVGVVTPSHQMSPNQSRARVR